MDVKRLPTATQRAGAAVALALVLGVSVAIGRSLAAPGVVPPPIGELRQEPNMLTLPARGPQSPAELAKSVDAIGVVHVDGVKATKERSQTSTATGVTTSWGHAQVTATVSTVLRGPTSTLGSFAFDCWFLPGTDALATPLINPPLEVGGDYLVFVQNGRLVYPDGAYRVSGGRVWNVGHWEAADFREYPG